jgi:hypothetical protein
MQFGKGGTEEIYQFLGYHWLFSMTIQEDLLAQCLEQIGQVVCVEISNENIITLCFKFSQKQLITCKVGKQLDSNPCFPINKIHTQGCVVLCRETLEDRHSWTLTWLFKKLIESQ